VMILTGNITASSSSVSGIESGITHTCDISRIENVAIVSANITAIGSFSGIGFGGECRLLQSVIIAGNSHVRCESNSVTFAVIVQSTTIADSRVFVTNQNHLFGVRPSKSGNLNQTVFHETLTSQNTESLSFTSGN
jgi:hypothetical protein